MDSHDRSEHARDSVRFGHIEIFASDVARSTTFYRDVLGFDVTATQADRFVWLQKGDLEILLRPGRPPQPACRYEDAPLGVVLYTDDLDGAVEGLRRRGLHFRGTVDSEKCPAFVDPDGNWLQLVDPDDH
jgi:catechol 2,3-dioxygenase-like lactoylglutathione lyase family enzyme